MSCCQQSASRVDSISRAAACVLCAGSSAVRCPVSKRPLQQIIYSVRYDECSRKLHPTSSGLVGRWIGLPLWKRCWLFVVASWHQFEVPALPGCGCWLPAVRFVKATHEGRVLLRSFFVTVFAIVGFTLLAAGCASSLTKSHGSSSSVPVAAQLASSKASIKQDTEKIELSVQQIESVSSSVMSGKSPPETTEKVFPETQRIMDAVTSLQETAEAVGRAGSTSAAETKECDKLREQLEESQRRQKELEMEANSKTRRGLYVVAIIATIGVGVFLFLRSFWLAGICGAVAGSCVVMVKVISAIDHIPNWIVWIVLGLLVAVVAWKVLADDMTQKGIVKSVSTFFQHKPELKEEWKKTASTIQGTAVSKYVHRIKDRLKIG